MILGKKITVYCSASNNIDSLYFKQAEQLAKAMVEKDFTLVYGGGQQGIMGTLANSILGNKGNVIGIIPQQIMHIETPLEQATEMIFVNSMRERKQLLEEYADAFLVLPGGMGTLDEMFEVLTLKTIGVNTKPFIIFNSNGFYSPLLNFLDSLKEQGFMKLHSLEQFIVCSSIEQVIDALDKALS